jgi:uncharacterized protein (TIGR02271 family)
MEQSELVIVTDENGRRGFIETPAAPEDNTSEIIVRFESGELAELPSRLFVSREDGSYGFLGKFSDFQTLPSESGERILKEDEDLTIPLVEEKVHVTRRAEETGRVRVTKAVREREEEVEVPHALDEVEVTRVPVNRIVDAPPPVRHEGDTMILPVLEEVTVVRKQLFLKEEVHIRRKRMESSLTERVRLRSEGVNIERVAPRGRQGPYSTDAAPLEEPNPEKE